MSNVATKKIFIQIETQSEQQEHLKNQRKTLKVLQGVATDKENLTGRTPIDKLSRLKALTESTPDFAKRKKVDTRPAETQTTPAKKNEADSSSGSNSKAITVEDLTSEGAAPSQQYWQRLAEKRCDALVEALDENQRLHERIDGLELELNTSRQMLQETRHLVEVLTEMLNENENNNDSDTTTTCSTNTETAEIVENIQCNEDKAAAEEED